ncbi:carbohydrate kinase family protein [Paramicrobacterium sp. CJ85]|uniref:carbohydrate kinase family protein n=1 Tax=Paramicrobacterium sp. CJ85 TaxID=3445355 RepID=UPI003F622B2F
MAASSFTPTDGTRRAPADLFLAGQLFYDVIFTGVSASMAAGTEVMADGMGAAPGGIANLALAASRLGLATSLCTGFGDDAYGKWAWSLLGGQEQIDLSRSRMFSRWHTAVTVSVATGDDRSMITHGHPLPESFSTMVGDLPAARAYVVDLQPDGDSWWEGVDASRTKVFADTGWDPTERWDAATLAPLDKCHAFLPNSVEARKYTRTETPEEALRVLADRVPLAVVTRGAAGAMAIDATTGEEASVPGLPVRAFDATGAGDVFAAGLVLGTLEEWPLEQRLRFAILCAALSVENFGGSLASPGWGDIADWWAAISKREDAVARGLAADYGFLSDVLCQHSTRKVRRAEATFGLLHEAEHFARQEDA